MLFFFFMQLEAVILQETLQRIILLSPASVTSRRELEMTDRQTETVMNEVAPRKKDHKYLRFSVLKAVSTCSGSCGRQIIPISACLDL